MFLLGFSDELSREKCIRIHFIDIDSVSSLYSLIVRTVQNNLDSWSRSRGMCKRLLKKNVFLAVGGPKEAYIPVISCRAHMSMAC